MAEMTGGCLCGQVRYSISGAPLATAVCHCTHCQRQGGAAFSVNVICLAPQLTIEGAPKTFEDSSDRGAKVLRRFCGDCGSPIVSELTSSPGVMAVKAGTLDDTSAVTPGVQVWCDSAQGWVKGGQVLGAVPAFPKDPPQG